VLSLAEFDTLSLSLSLSLARARSLSLSRPRSLSGEAAARHDECNTIRRESEGKN